MAHTWKYAFGLGLAGAAFMVSCVVKNGDDDVAGAGGQAADGGSGGSSAKGGTGGTGGSTAGKGGSGGTGGSSAGKGGAGGTAGSTATGGKGGTGDAGMAGTETGGSAGTSGTGGTGGTVDTSPTCDPLKDSTPYPSCAPTDKGDPCETCIQSKCCDESNDCYSTDPYNVCGWGGPTADQFMGEYSGTGEIGCYTQCLTEYVKDMGVCDSDGIDACTSMCQTEMCGLVGDATNALAGCMQENCPSECFGADTCG
jgi:hypothetical protein